LDAVQEKIRYGWMLVLVLETGEKAAKTETV
jgi:hypothetical protein